MLKRKAKDWVERMQLPAAAKSALRRDRAALLGPDPGPERVIDEGINGWDAPRTVR
jgi:hypothetical protein